MHMHIHQLAIHGPVVQARQLHTASQHHEFLPLTEGWQYCDANDMIHRLATVQEGDRAGERPVIMISPPIAPCKSRDRRNPENHRQTSSNHIQNDRFTIY